MKRKIFFLAIILLASFCFATSTKELFSNMSEESYKRLINGEVICAVLTPDKQFSFFSDLESMGMKQDFSSNETIHSVVPKGSESEKSTAEINDIKQGFYVTSIAFLPYPEKLKAMDPSERQNYIFGLATKISTLKGLQYNSHFAGDKIVELFKDSYICNEKTPQEPIEDPAFSSAPETFSCYAMIKDNRFGSNIYKIDYKTNPDEIFMDIKNVGKMKFLLITCLNKEALDMYVDVIQTDEGLALFTMAKTNSKIPEISFGPIELDIPASFIKRIVALGRWLSNNLYE